MRKKIVLIVSSIISAVLICGACSSTDGGSMKKRSDAADKGMKTEPLTYVAGDVQDNPFPKGLAGSACFRIPALITLADGSLFAAADARWNTTYDGGGLDTMAARSKDNGKNWEWAFVNYLGDNGNAYNGADSTCFIDPALATDGKQYGCSPIYIPTALRSTVPATRIRQWKPVLTAKVNCCCVKKAKADMIITWTAIK